MLWLTLSHYVPLCCLFIYCQHDINISKPPRNQHFSKSTPTKRLLCWPPRLLSHHRSVLANAVMITELCLAAWRMPTAPNQQLQVLINDANLRVLPRSPRRAESSSTQHRSERRLGDSATRPRVIENAQRTKTYSLLHFELLRADILQSKQGVWRRKLE